MEKTYTAEQTDKLRAAYQAVIDGAKHGIARVVVGRGNYRRNYGIERGVNDKRHAIAIKAHLNIA